MADVITRLKLESGEYDSKVKRATQGLLQMEQEFRKVGSTLAVLEKEQKQYVQSLGSMQTVSTTVRGKLGELTQAYTELRVQYNRLTEEEKKGDFGKALSSSLTQLNQRIQQTKKELSDVNKELSGMDKLEAGGLFGGSKISGMLAVFGGNVMTKIAGMATGLVTELGDCIKQGVELAKQGEGIRIAFERLGRGDILDGLREATHGTVTDLELMKAAVKFNDFKLPLDELGTMLAFAQQKAKDTGQSVDYMVDSIVTGLGRKSLMILDNLGLSATEIKERMKETGDMTKAVGAIIRDQMAKAGDYVETAADRAAQANVSLQNKMEELGRKFAPVEEASNQLWTSMKIGILDIIGGPLTQLLNGLTEAGRMKNALAGMGGNEQVNNQLGKLRVAKAAGSGYMTRSLYSGQVEQYNRQINTADSYLKQYDSNHSSVNTVLMAASKQFGQKFDSISDLKAFKDAYVSMKNEYVKGAQEIMNATKQATTTDTTDTKKKKATKTEQTEIQKNEEQIKKLSLEYAKLGDVETEASRKRQEEIKKEIELLQQRNGLLGLRMEQAQGRLLPSSGDFDKNTKNVGGIGMLDQTTNFGKNIEIPSGGLQLSDKQMKAVNKSISGVSSMADGIDKSFTSAASAVSALGSAFASIEDPAAKVIGTVSQAIATVALGYATATTQAATMGPWAWIAFAATGLATMISTISAIHSATGYANGGLIGKAANGMLIGNSYSGDNLRLPVNGGGFIGVNAGELILNRAQQGVIADALEGGNALQNLQLNAVIKGEQIRLVLNNNGRRTGRGEYVQTNRR